MCTDILCWISVDYINSIQKLWKQEEDEHMYAYMNMARNFRLIIVTRSSRGSHRNREWCWWQSKCTECTKPGDAAPDFPRTHECSWSGGTERWSRNWRAWCPRCCGGTRSHTPDWAPTTALPNRCPASGSALAVFGGHLVHNGHMVFAPPSFHHQQQRH